MASQAHGRKQIAFTSDGGVADALSGGGYRSSGAAVPRPADPDHAFDPRNVTHAGGVAGKVGGFRVDEETGAYKERKVEAARIKARNAGGGVGDMFSGSADAAAGGKAPPTSARAPWGTDEDTVTAAPSARSGAGGGAGGVPWGTTSDGAADAAAGGGGGKGRGKYGANAHRADTNHIAHPTSVGAHDKGDNVSAKPGTVAPSTGDYDERRRAAQANQAKHKSAGLW